LADPSISCVLLQLLEFGSSPEISTVASTSLSRETLTLIQNSSGPKKQKNKTRKQKKKQKSKTDKKLFLAD
jgi:hypothetical protein